MSKLVTEELYKAYTVSYIGDSLELWTSQFDLFLNTNVWATYLINKKRFIIYKQGLFF